MVRWKNRTPEDQARVIREQQALRDSAAQKKVPFHNTYMAIKTTENRAMEIYKRASIPIICLEHGWVESEKYVLGKMKNPLTGDQFIDSIQGKCPDCGRDIVRAFPVGNEILLFQLAMLKLKEDGCLEDRRGK